MLARVRAEMAEQALSRALEVVFEVVAAANRYVDAQAPWALRKTDPLRMATVLYVLAETIRRLALVTQAFMPDASARILDQLAVPEDARSLASFEDRRRRCSRARPCRRRAGCSRALPTKPPEPHARRQPLPPRFSGARRAARRR